MQHIEATYRVVTPMFMSGADQSKAELRLPSIKGALRFWWRALAWEWYGGRLEEIKAQEANIFGDTKKQSQLLLKLIQIPSDKHFKDANVVKTSHPFTAPDKYLAYGAFHGDLMLRGYTTDILNPYGSGRMYPSFLLSICFKKTLPIKLVNSVIKAIKLQGLIGGLGSRSRRGYGSLVLEQLSQGNTCLWKAPSTFDDYKACLREVLPTCSSGLPSYTAFSKESRQVLLLSKDQERPESLLKKIGEDFIFFRSWGKNGKVLNDKSEENFENDHDLMKEINRNISHPERVVFGLPHNYGKDKRLHVTPKNYERRSSPLFFHVHQSSKGVPILVLTFLPATFLPKDETLKVLDNDDIELNHNGFWQPVHDFLDRMLGNPKNNSSLKPRKSEFVDSFEVTL